MAGGAGFGERDAGQHHAALLTIPQVRRVYL